MRGEVIYSFLIIVTDQYLLVNNQKVYKCCDKEMEFRNGTYSCKISEKTYKPSTRTNLIYDHSDNGTQCVDIINQIVLLFKKNNFTFDAIEKLNAPTKCCPLDYVYNPSKRSCIKNISKRNRFDEKFIKIGLAHCELISDILVISNTDIVSTNISLTIIKTGEVFLRDQFCLDETDDGIVVARVCRTLRFCKKVICIRKCCPDGESFINGSHCANTYVNGLDLERFKNFVGELKGDFAIRHGYEGRVYIEPNISMFYLDKKGNFFNEKTETISPYLEHPYCIEHAAKNGRTYGHIYFGFLVGSNPPMAKKFFWNRGAMIVSGAFLVLTIIYYVFSGEARKVFGKTLICFCCSLLLLYTLLVYHTFTTNLHHKPTKNMCKIVGFIIIYLGFCIFIWLQIMCYDIQCTFGASSKHQLKIDKKRREFFKFLWYNIYGWGMPFLYTVILAIFHLTDFLPNTIDLDMAVTKCAIEKGNYAEILFRAIPLTMIQMFNIILFTKTIIYVLQVKKEIKQMVETPSTMKKKRKFFKRKERFGLVVKLSITMGVLYLFEVISSFFDFNDYKATAILEIIWDFINCLQGLFIFLIFVCKRRNYDKLKKSNAMKRIRKLSLSPSRKTSLTTIANVNNNA